MVKQKIALMAGGILVGAAAMVGASSFASSNRPAHPGMTSMRQMHRHPLDGVASVLGVKPADLRSELKTKTLQQIVQEHGMTLDQFHQKLRDDLTSKLRGKGLSDSQIKERLSQFDQHLQVRQHLLQGLGPISQ